MIQLQLNMIKEEGTKINRTLTSLIERVARVRVDINGHHILKPRYGGLRITLCFTGNQSTSSSLNALHVWLKGD